MLITTLGSTKTLNSEYLRQTTKKRGFALFDKSLFTRRCAKFVFAYC